DGGQVDGDAVEPGDEVDGVVQRAQHAQAEQVELHQPGGRAVVLVPLEHGTTLHRGPLDGAHLDDRAVADDHAARADAEVAGEVLDLPGQRQHVVGDGVSGRFAPIAGFGGRAAPVGRALGGDLAQAAPAIELLGE